MLTTTSAFAQIQYANSVISAVNAGFVVDDYKAADGDLSTNATIAPAVLLGFTRLRVSFPKTAQANQPAGLYLRPNNPLLNIALLAGGTVNTYMQSGGTTTPLESFALSGNLLNLSLLTSGVTKATFTPTKQFNQVEFVFFSVLSLGQDMGFYEAFSTPVTPLPVVLTSFKAKTTPAGVSIQWETASEMNAHHFVVERATEVGGSFQALGQVLTAGTSTQAKQYAWQDNRPPTGFAYYRLRQVDLDGTETFSLVVAIRVERASSVLAAYPSPATDYLTVVGPPGASVLVVDQTGRQMRHVYLDEARALPLDVQSLPAGLYFLQDAATGQRTKFMKAAQ